MGSREIFNLLIIDLLTWKSIDTLQIGFTRLVWIDRLKFIKITLNLVTHLSYAVRLKRISENMIHVDFFFLGEFFFHMTFAILKTAGEGGGYF